MLCENILKVGICFYDNMSKFINGLKNFQVIPRKLIFDNSLSDRARFVYCFMASKPDGWDFLLNPMANELGYSVETLRKYINENEPGMDFEITVERPESLGGGSFKTFLDWDDSVFLNIA